VRSFGPLFKLCKEGMFRVRYREQIETREKKYQDFFLKQKTKLVLGDRAIGVTIQRGWSLLPLSEKFKLMFQLAKVLFCVFL
jgi:hypothetical protein